jgi:steroid 5-alpha reductase family enzyme
MTLGELLGPSLFGLAAGAALGLCVWLVSLRRHDVSIVDAAWSFQVWLPAAMATAALATTGARALPLLALALAWAMRLSLHILRRQHGQPEDPRYQDIRARNQPNFQIKSLVLVFGLQAVLGWIVSAPLLAAAASDAPWRALDIAGFALMLFGIAFEAVADAQLARFKADPAQRGRVMDRGLWRYSRHPNYFGECCVWWGVWLVAAAAGAAWTVFSPLLMTLLLLRVSGVALLEKDIGQRRPGYADYIRRTNAFVPGRPRP